MYHGEVIIDGSVKASHNYGNVAHPNHVARRLVHQFLAHPYVTLYIINKDGDLWKYAFDNTTGVPKGTIVKTEAKFNKHQTTMIFSGASTIRGEL